MQYLTLLILGVIILALMLVIGLVLTRLYKRTTPHEALVRTGVGGMKVAMGGGLIYVPGLHDLLRVNLKTMAITVNAGDGLITKDQRRVDAIAEFYIRVKPEEVMIKTAARSLGADTNNVEKIRSQLEGKVQDSLRSITAGMDLIEIQQKRGEFVEKVREAMSSELEPNGLELESVSLKHLDETPVSKLDENNTFDVTGMRARAEIIAEQSKKKVKTEEEASVEIAKSQQASRLSKLSLEQSEAEAMSKQRLAIARTNADADAEEAKISEDLERSREIARISRESSIREEEITRQQNIDIASQKAKIEVAQHSEAQSLAEAKANEARAKAIAAEESVITARATETANREKSIAVIESEREAEQGAVKIRIQARAEREAAEDYAAATIARAKADAEAEQIRAEAVIEVGKAEAEARRALVAAENEMSPAIMQHKLQIETVARLPEIIAAMTEPLRHVDSIRISQVAGLNGGAGPDGAGAASGGDTGLVGELMSGMRRNAVAMPALQELGRQIGLDLSGDPQDIVNGIVAGQGRAPAAPKNAGAGRKRAGDSTSSPIVGDAGL